MTINLPNELENRLQATVQSGRFASVDDAIAEAARLLFRELERIGLPIGTSDTMIAAIAIENGLELVTGNTSDFQHVRNLGYPLALVNWRT